MAVTIEGAIRMDDERILETDSLDGIIMIGMKNGKSVRVPHELIRNITTPFEFTPEQKEAARDNIGAMGVGDIEFEEYSATEYEDV